MNEPKRRSDLVYAITHDDLDGIGCAILLEKVFPKVNTLAISYMKLPDALPVVLAQSNGYPLYITDIALTDELAELCNRHGKVQHIDHHVSNAHIPDKYPWSLVDTSNCATYHLFRLLSNYANLQDYSAFVNLVNIYDTWGHGTQPTPDAKNLNRLFQCIGPDAFLNRFKLKASVALSDTEKAIVNADKYNEERYIEEAKEKVQTQRDPEGHNFALIAAERYTSSLGNAILVDSPDIDYVLILDFLNEKASLRGKGKVDVSAIAKKCGGGGHKKSAGFVLTDTVRRSFWGCDDCELRQRGSHRDTDMDEQVRLDGFSDTQVNE